MITKLFVYGGRIKMITKLFVCDKCDKEVRGEINSFYQISIANIKPNVTREIKRYDICDDCNEDLKNYMHHRPFQKVTKKDK